MALSTCPLVLEGIDAEEMGSRLPTIAALLQGGLITIDPVTVIRCQPHPDASLAGDPASPFTVVHGHARRHVDESGSRDVAPRTVILRGAKDLALHVGGAEILHFVQDHEGGRAARPLSPLASPMLTAGQHRCPRGTADVYGQAVAPAEAIRALCL
jgi:hypothetical protein